MSNEYESQEIYVDISPSDRYVIDHITYYSLDEDSYEKRIEAKGVLCNLMAGVLTIRVYCLLTRMFIMK